MLDLSTLSCDQAIQESNPLATLLGGILGNRSLLFRANLRQMLSLYDDNTGGRKDVNRDEQNSNKGGNQLIEQQLN